MRSTAPNALARAVHGFFGPYLMEQRGLSRHTVLSYRDTLALLLRFIAQTRRTDPATLDLDALTADVVLAFLNHLESDRHNKTSSRNVRLAAIHAFARYVSIQFPERLQQVQQILGIPFKRAGTRPIEYFEYDEIRAILDNVDRATPTGRRDYALLALMFNSGARVQEIVDIGACDLQLQFAAANQARRERTQDAHLPPLAPDCKSAQSVRCRTGSGLKVQRCGVLQSTRRAPDSFRYSLPSCQVLPDRFWEVSISDPQATAPPQRQAQHCGFPAQVRR